MKNKSVFKINDVIMYLAVAVEHLRLMLLILCLSLLVGLTYYCFARPVYSSRTLVRVDFSQQIIGNGGRNRDLICRMLESDSLMERTAKKLGVNATSKELERNWIKRLKVSPTFEGIQIEIWPYQRSWA